MVWKMAGTAILAVPACIGVVVAWELAPWTLYCLVIWAGIYAVYSRPSITEGVKKTIPTLGKLIAFSPKIIFWLFAATGMLAGFVLGSWYATHWDARLRSNEHTAIICLRNYATGQTLFSLYHKNHPEKRMDHTLANGDESYADNFRNLQYGEPEPGRGFWLINQYMADAFLIDNMLGGAPTGGEGPKSKSLSYQGYFFQEDPTGPPVADYNRTFAMMAFPEFLGKTGRYVYWIGHDAILYRQRPDAPEETTALQLLDHYRTTPHSTPFSPHPVTAWEVVERRGLY